MQVVKKDFKCGPGCRCNKCGNADSGNITPGMQQHPTLTEVQEVEEEELLHDLFQAPCGYEFVSMLMSQKLTTMVANQKVKTDL